MKRRVLSAFMLGLALPVTFAAGEYQGWEPLPRGANDWQRLAMSDFFCAFSRAPAAAGQAEQRIHANSFTASCNGIGLPSR